MDLAQDDPRPLRKVLIIANLNHASPRLPGIAQYFTSYGWEPTILTTSIEAGKDAFNAPSLGPLKGMNLVQVGETSSYESRKGKTASSKAAMSAGRLVDRLSPLPGSPLRRAMEGWYWRLQYFLSFPDPEKGWKGPALQAAKDLVLREIFDLILSSSSPATAHMVASELHAHSSIPWVAELRDLWSGNHNLPAGRWMRWRTSRLERSVLTSAAALVTVSPFLAEELSRAYPEKKVFWVTNGFDPLPASAGARKPSALTITYTGQVYPGKQDASKFLEALASLSSKGQIDRRRVSVRFFGPKSDDVGRLIDRLGLSDVVAQMGVVTREEARMHQAESHLLLLLNWEDEKEYGVAPLKLFEYLATGSPLLVTGGKPGDMSSRVVVDTGSGAVAYTREETEMALLDYYQRFVQDGTLTSSASPNAVAKYTYESLCARYSGILAEVLETARARSP
jgi:glycosyltransferase involved in cell wall biosynthesis